MKKYIFTESQVKKIINNQLNETPDDQKIAIDQGSLEFLNIKGIKGIDLTQRITAYQKMIGCEPTGHMMDCIEIMYTKYPKDFNLWKEKISSNKPILDWLIEKIKRGFGIKSDPKAIY
jgi:ABC-type proline/glycine betaine transport system substrate-binding protein